MTETRPNGEGAASELISVHEQVAGTRDGDAAAFFDDLFDALSHRRRRTVLTLLRSHGEMGVTSLADHIVADERAELAEAARDDEVTRVKVSLFHQHLPKLDDVGLVDFDSAARHVSLTDSGERLDFSADLAALSGTRE